MEKARHMRAKSNDPRRGQFGYSEVSGRAGPAAAFRQAVPFPHLLFTLPSSPVTPVTRRRVSAARILRLVPIVLLVTALATACGGEIDGTYADPTGAMTLEFRSGGEVRASTMGMTTAGTYELGDDEVVVEFNNRRMVFQREEDRLTSGPLVLTRRD